MLALDDHIEKTHRKFDLFAVTQAAEKKITLPFI